MAKQVKKKEPLLRKQDFLSYVEEKAREIAPRDVEVLLLDAEQARTAAHTVSDRIGIQMALALELLADHQSGECPQIPFYTVSLLAEAVYYFLDPNDVIPDWIPDIGRLDDALVMELAFELGVDGVQRYCAWKDIDDSAIYRSAGAAVATAATKKSEGSKPGKTKAKSKVSKKVAKPKAKAKPKSKVKAKAKTATKAKVKTKPAGKKRGKR